MSSGSGIEWTEATWNPVTGCTRVSSGCDHCWEEDHRLPRFQGDPMCVRTIDPKGGYWGEWPWDLRVREMPEAAIGGAR